MLYYLVISTETWIKRNNCQRCGSFRKTEGKQRGREWRDATDASDGQDMDLLSKKNVCCGRLSRGIWSENHSCILEIDGLYLKQMTVYTGRTIAWLSKETCSVQGHLKWRAGSDVETSARFAECHFKWMVCWWAGVAIDRIPNVSQIWQVCGREGG